MKTLANQICVVIPVYKQMPSGHDDVSLNQCRKIFSNKYTLICVKPNSLILNWYNKSLFTRVYSFDDFYFESISGYNALMLSEIFYERFSEEFKFILIYQTDSMVFDDQLLYWCNKGYDYIGAPWSIKLYGNTYERLKNSLYTKWSRVANLKQPLTHFPIEKQFENAVGNGGFSLRRTSKFLSICRCLSHKTKIYKERSERYFNEDVFWSIEANRIFPNIKKPNYKVAANFSMENDLRDAFKLTEGYLPFGCHAWHKYLPFWLPVFKALGID